VSAHAGKRPVRSLRDKPGAHRILRDRVNPTEPARSGNRVTDSDADGWTWGYAAQ
jgi:hypothetical protein